MGDGSCNGEEANHIGTVDRFGDASKGCDDLTVGGVAENDQAPCRAGCRGRPGLLTIVVRRDGVCRGRRAGGRQRSRGDLGRKRAGSAARGP